MMFTKREEKNLSTLLGKVSDPEAVLTLEGVHGFLFGLAIMPEPVLPSEWLPALFGEEMIEIENERQGQELIGHLFSAYNRINLLDEQDRLAFPFTADKQKDEDTQKIREWAKGLFRSMSLRPGVWGIGDGEEPDGEEMMKDEKAVTSSYGIIMGVAVPERASQIFSSVLHKNDPLDNSQIVSILHAALPHAIAVVREHGNRLRDALREVRSSRPAAAPPQPRRVDKVGRNDPCPCGSGRKYKKCCGG